MLGVHSDILQSKWYPQHDILYQAGDMVLVMLVIVLVYCITWYAQHDMLYQVGDIVLVYYRLDIVYHVVRTT